MHIKNSLFFATRRYSDHPLGRLSKQRGIAFITAMLIMMIAVTVSVSLFYQQQIDIRLTSNIQRTGQAWQYVYAAEDWAGSILRKDQQDSEIDSLDENWAIPIPAIDIPGGLLSGHLQDLQARFALNNLINAEDKVDEHQQRVLQRLLEQLGVDSMILSTTADWIDKNNETVAAEGAESDYYLTLDPPYLTADGFLHHITELRLLRGIDAEAYKTLKPFVNTLVPSDDLQAAQAQAQAQTQTSTNNASTTDNGTTADSPFTVVAATSDVIPININTAPKELLLALGMSDTDIDTALESRDDSPWQEVTDFLDYLSYLPEEERPPAGMLSVSSQYFLLSATITMEPAVVRFDSVLFRDKNGNVKTIMRDFAAK